MILRGGLFLILSAGAAVVVVEPMAVVVTAAVVEMVLALVNDEVEPKMVEEARLNVSRFVLLLLLLLPSPPCS